MASLRRLKTLCRKYNSVAPYGFVFKGELAGLAKQFVDFTFSAKGKRF